MKKLIMLVAFALAVPVLGCDNPNLPTDMQGRGKSPTIQQKRHYAHSGLVVAPAATSVLRFATDPLPALNCGEPWPYGYSSIPGVLDGLVTTVKNGRTLVSFTATIYNSSTTESFVVPNSPANLDEHGDVRDFFAAELLDNSGVLLQTAGRTAFCMCEVRPVSCGFAPSEEYLTLAPQWADTYSANMDGQSFDMTDLIPGRYIIHYTIDPTNKYGEFQVYEYDVTWDGSVMTAR